MLNSNKQWVNHEVYRLMYKEDLYILAYERIKSKPGNMTAGTDGETLDGFSLEDIREIIQEMKTEQFRFKPVRQEFIPKPNGKMRKLGIPCVRDKIVQEVIRLILEAIGRLPSRPLFQRRQSWISTRSQLSHSPSRISREMVSGELAY
jgi:retron-type reverse transcriptase